MFITGFSELIRFLFGYYLMKYLLSPYYDPGVVLGKKNNDRDKFLLSGNLVSPSNQSFHE